MFAICCYSLRPAKPLPSYYYNILSYCGLHCTIIIILIFSANNYMHRFKHTAKHKHKESATSQEMQTERQNRKYWLLPLQIYLLIYHCTARRRRCRRSVAKCKKQTNVKREEKKNEKIKIVFQWKNTRNLSKKKKKQRAFQTL